MRLCERKSELRRRFGPIVGVVYLFFNFSCEKWAVLVKGWMVWALCLGGAFAVCTALLVGEGFVGAS